MCLDSSCDWAVSVARPNEMVPSSRASLLLHPAGRLLNSAVMNAARMTLDRSLSFFSDRDRPDPREKRYVFSVNFPILLDKWASDLFPVLIYTFRQRQRGVGAHTLAGFAGAASPDTDPPTRRIRQKGDRRRAVTSKLACSCESFQKMHGVG